MENKDKRERYQGWKQPEKDEKEGRKSYPREHDDEIMELYRRGLPIGQTVKEICCSLGHVQDVVKCQKREEKNRANNI